MSQEPLDRALADIDSRLVSSAGAGDDTAALARARSRVRKHMVSTPPGRVPIWPSRLLVPVAVLLPVAAAAALALALVTGQHRPPTTVPGATSPAPTGPASPQPSPSVAAISPPPADFQPGAVSAISENEFWVLGTTGCTPARCAASVVHTLDGGRHFTSVASPPTPAFGQPGTDSIRDIRFAGPLDGWVFGPSVWSTHDGGAHWTQLDLKGNDVSELEPGTGAVYALMTDRVCTQPSCGSRLLTTSSGSDAWAAVSLPQPISGLAHIAVHGGSLWIMYNGGSAALWASSDRGASFNRYSYPCDPSLDGSLAPVSESVIWGFCATGMQGHPLVSSDGGRSFSTPGSDTSFPNNGIVAPISTRQAVIASSGVPLRRTGDGGATWHSALAQSGPGSEFAWVGFTDSSVGYAIERLTGQSGGQTSRLWRTTDGGSSWSLVRFVP